MLGLAISTQRRRATAEVWLRAGTMKLIEMDDQAKVAMVECPCGGQTIISILDASERDPRMGWCPVCGRVLLYPTDLKT